MGRQGHRVRASLYRNNDIWKTKGTGGIACMYITTLVVEQVAYTMKWNLFKLDEGMVECMSLVFL